MCIYIYPPRFHLSQFNVSSSLDHYWPIFLTAESQSCQMSLMKSTCPRVRQKTLAGLSVNSWNQNQLSKFNKKYIDILIDCLDYYFFLFITVFVYQKIPKDSQWKKDAIFLGQLWKKSVKSWQIGGASQGPKFSLCVKRRKKIRKIHAWGSPKKHLLIGRLLCVQYFEVSQATG